MNYQALLEKACEWIKKADRDIEAAKGLLREGIYDYAFFHAQQAVEKYLKAFLTLNNKPIRKNT